MDVPLEEQYFIWLYQKVASVRLKNPARTYWSLLRQLHRKEFVWLIPNDDNRQEDGLALRNEFLNETGGRGDTAWMDMGCSMLEMLIALALRLEYESMTDDGVDDWFWRMLQHLELNEYTDLYFTNHFTVQIVDQTLDRVIWRQYDENGYGGLFPLQGRHGDQRKVELMYQAASYLLEHE